jgi:hypothetical protein
MNKKHGLRIGIALFVLAAMFTLAGCEDPGSGGGDTIEGNVSADSSGRLTFSFHSGLGGSDECDVTTNLDAPNNAFTVVSGVNEKIITGLAPGQEVNYTVSVKKGTILETTWEGGVSISCTL